MGLKIGLAQRGLNGLNGLNQLDRLELQAEFIRVSAGLIEVVGEDC